MSCVLLLFFSVVGCTIRPGRWSEEKTKLAAPMQNMYLGKQDDELFQPILVYLPLLAHGSGVGGVVSSERLLSFS